MATSGSPTTVSAYHSGWQDRHGHGVSDSRASRSQTWPRAGHELGTFLQNDVLLIPAVSGSAIFSVAAETEALDLTLCLLLAAHTT